MKNRRGKRSSGGSYYDVNNRQVFLNRRQLLESGEKEKKGSS